MSTAAAPTAPASSPEGTDSVTDAEDAIPVLRGQIDSLDQAIVRLVAERAKLSHRVQTARMNAGGTRVQLGRARRRRPPGLPRSAVVPTTSSGRRPIS
jgi:hypothetical protein